VKINRESSLKDIALIVGKLLHDLEIDAVLVGGAVVSIYSDNKYQSYDLDFISFTDLKTLEIVLTKIGFYKEGNYFKHNKTEFFIEFPTPPVSVGKYPVHEFNIIKSKNGFLKLLTPTYCIMDRLAGFYFWDDWQSLDQAILVAQLHKTNFTKIKEWSQEEGELDKYNIFLKRLKEIK